MKTAITWERLIQILEVKNPIVGGEYGNADYVIGNDEDVVDFLQDVDGEDAETTVLQEDNKIIIFENNVLFLTDSAGDEIEFTFSQTIPFDFNESPENSVDNPE